MFKNSAPQTKSFLILFGIAVVGVYLSFMLSNNLTGGNPGNNYSAVYYNQTTSKLAGTAMASAAGLPPFKTIDTSNWKTYTEAEHGLSFKYDPAWTVLPGKTDKDGYFVLQIDPGLKFYNIKIYISKTSFFAMDGLPAVTQIIANETAINVSNLLYGIHRGAYYYTFDNGLSTNMIDGFNALVRTVKFN
jgi:hypothetical protein